jgi:hypothetical protein
VSCVQTPTPTAALSSATSATTSGTHEPVSRVVVLLASGGIPLGTLVLMSADVLMPGSELMDGSSTVAAPSSMRRDRFDECRSKSPVDSLARRRSPPASKSLGSRSTRAR